MKYWDLDLDLKLDFKKPRSENIFGLALLLKQKEVARRMSKLSKAIKVEVQKTPKKTKNLATFDLRGEFS